jgi:hypothetical protein
MGGSAGVVGRLASIPDGVQDVCRAAAGKHLGAIILALICEPYPPILWSCCLWAFAHIAFSLHAQGGHV